MNILIIGGGSLGLLLAGKLASSAEGQIHLLTHTPAQAGRIRTEGISVIDQGDLLTAKLPCSSFSDHVNHKEQYPQPRDKWDWIFLLVKQTQLERSLIDYVAGLLDKRQTNLLCFQNGIGHADKLATSVSVNQIYLAVTTEGAQRVSEYEVNHTGKGVTTIGPAFEHSVYYREAQIKLQQCLNNAGFKIKLSKNMDKIVWNKLLINSVINPLTAILRIRNGALISSTDYVLLMKALYDEALLVADKAGVETDVDGWQQLLSVCRHTAENSSSMLQDVLQDRETEIEAISGSIIQIAEQLGVDIPTHKVVYHMVKGLESGENQR